jgi:DNA-binding PadR family transcriptional regulator
MRKPVKQKKAGPSKPQPPGNQSRLTTPDLVILSLLAERPMHGYEVNATLEDRKIREWAPVSRAQIYYSLDKLTELQLIGITAEDSASAGPERQVFETTAIGRERLADALEGDHWAHDPVYQPFLIWLALSWQARPDTLRRQLRSRQDFLEKRIADARATLHDVLAEVGHPYHEAVWMLQLTIEQSESELRWVQRILAEAGKRAPAKKPKK